ncbi:AsnC family transcriptional regulator [Ruegeria sp. ANG-S4]|nr:AsnC family transcriptional regulator [Ruegeria sp. ANG-S4]
MVKSANLDQFDRQILSVLQTEGRISNVELADRIGLSPTPCLRRVRALEEEGIIEGYQAHLDRESVGLGMTVFVEITVSRHSDDNAKTVQDQIASLPGCVACHMVSGAADFLVEMVVADLQSYERILSEHLLVIDMIASIRSNFSLRPIKTNGALTLPE